MKHEPSLDGIRAVAVIFVVLHHAFPNAFVGGWIGVNIFFVLSGYLISNVLRSEIELTGNLSFRNFYARRMLRLVPAVSCLYAFEITRAIFSSRRPEILQSVAVSAAYFMNWNKAFGLFPEGNLGHTWSLSTEEQFYLLWPIVLLLIWHRRPMIWISAAIVAVMLWRCYLVLAGASMLRIYGGFDTHCDGLLIGCWLAFAGERTKLTIAKIWPLTIGSLCVAPFTLSYASYFMQSIGLTLVSILGAGLIAAALYLNGIGLILSLPAAVFTGRISYGWYLWHYPLMMLVTAKFGTGISGLALIAACIPASYLVATASYFVVERPFLRIKDHLIIAAGSPPPG